MFGKRLAGIALLAIWLELFLFSTADAYLDPGTGSFVCQILLAGIFALGFILKSYWAKIKTLLAKLFSKDV